MYSSQKTGLLNVLKELQKVCNHPFLFAAAEKDAFKAARTTGRAWPRGFQLSSTQLCAYCVP